MKTAQIRAVGEIAQRGSSLLGAARRRQRHRRQAEIAEPLRHECAWPTLTQKPSARMLDGISDLPSDLLDDEMRPGVVAVRTFSSALMS